MGKGRRRLVAVASSRNPKLPGTRRPSPYPQHQLLRGRRRLVAVASRRNPELSGTRRPSPHPKPQSRRGWRRPVSSSHALATQSCLGRDVPAPIQSLNHVGAGDVPSPAPTPSQPKASWDETSQPPSRPSMTSELVISSALLLTFPNQPLFKTLKGFQTVAGGKAARPPPPVPCPQNVQPPPPAEGVGGGGIPETPQAVSPNPSRCSAIPRWRKKAQ